MSSGRPVYATQKMQGSCRDSLEVAWRSDVGFGQPLLLPALVLLLSPGEGGVHEVVHLRVAEALEADLGILDVHCGHGQRRT